VRALLAADPAVTGPAAAATIGVSLPKAYRLLRAAKTATGSGKDAATG
jgi:hypothetical protein